jgi:hypothetical protein
LHSSIALTKRFQLFPEHGHVLLVDHEDLRTGFSLDVGLYLVGDAAGAAAEAESADGLLELS